MNQQLFNVLTVIMITGLLLANFFQWQMWQHQQEINRIMQNFIKITQDGFKETTIIMRDMTDVMKKK